MGCCCAHPHVGDERDIDEMDVASSSEVKTEQGVFAVNAFKEGQADPLLAQQERTEYIDANVQIDNTRQHASHANVQPDNTFQHGPYANVQTDNTYQPGPCANMQSDKTNQRGNELTLPVSNDRKEQPLPSMNEISTVIMQGAVEVTHEEPNRSQANVLNQADEIGTQVTEEEFHRNQVKIDNQKDGYVHEAVKQTTGVTHLTQEEFNRSQVSVDNQRDGYVHEAVDQAARSGDVGVVFEGRVYNKRVFDEFLKDYVYVRDENQNTLVKNVM